MRKLNKVDDYGVDLEEISRIIREAEVLVVQFQVINKRLLLDFRTSSVDGPFVKVVEPAGTTEERFRSIRILRPTFSSPKRILTILWPRSMASLKSSGVLESIDERIIEISIETNTDMIQEAFNQLVKEEAATINAAIKGAEGFQTLWEKKRLDNQLGST